MNVDKLWNEIKLWLLDEKMIELQKGGKFKVIFDINSEIIEIIPIKSGISRRINKEEWIKFGNKFNSVKNEGYDPFRPGHYAKITFNSSYLVAIIKEYGYSE